MSASILHLGSQRDVLAALGRVALSALARRPSGAAPTQLPGPWLEAEVAPRPSRLVDDYVRASGGDPSSYRGVLPPHFFPQWSFPLAARALEGLPYPLARVVNAGCRLEPRAPLPRGEALFVRARLEAIDDDGRRARLTTRIVTGTKHVEDALVADMHAVVPLAAPGDRRSGGGAKKPRATVPADAREIAFFRLAATAGRDFAILTGDVNPIHWLAPYARASGFRACILHGFATLARALEALHRGVFAGDASRLALADVRFTRPLVLPAKVGVYTAEGGKLFVGDAPSGAAYLDGRYEARP